MGCTSGKNQGDCKMVSQKLESLIASYSSIESYIQTLRQSTYENFLTQLSDKELQSINLSEEEKIEMDCMENDLQLFKRFKNINKYKYDILVSKFLRSIKSCMIKIQGIDQVNGRYLDELNEYRNSPRGSKISKVFEKRVYYLQELIIKVTNYLENQTHSKLASDQSSNYYTLEISSTNSKRLNAYSFPHFSSKKNMSSTQSQSSSPTF